MIDLDELERKLAKAIQDGLPWEEGLAATMRWNEAITEAAPELIAMARQADALRAAVCKAVVFLNQSPGKFEALDTLRQALIDYADAMQEQKP